jgi:hypothetical protein
MPAPKAPVLVTGSIRSGTTWVGGMLALAPGTEIVHEPFNPSTGPGVFPGLPRTPLLYLCDENGGPYGEALERTLGFRYGHLRQLTATRSRDDLVGATRDARRFAAARRSAARPIVKDALAVLSAEWMAARFDARVVMLVRHPAAVVSSIVRLGWQIACPWLFLEQPLLLRDRLAGFEDELVRASSRAMTLLDQAILFWRVVYGTVYERWVRNPDWLVRRQEDIAADPDRGFRELYAALDLDYTDGVRAQILRHSAPGNPVEWSAPHDVRLDSRAGIGRWQTRLTDDEIARVRAGTGDVCRHFYGDEDWDVRSEAELLDRAS